MLRAILIAGLLAVAAGACGDNTRPAAGKDDAGVTPPDSSPPDPDAPPMTVGPCIDRPTDLDRPPGTTLPCELLPPGFVQP